MGIFDHALKAAPNLIDRKPPRKWHRDIRKVYTDFDTKYNTISNTYVLIYIYMLSYTEVSHFGGY
jgi:hypothetical protein